MSYLRWRGAAGYHYDQFSGTLPCNVEERVRERILIAVNSFNLVSLFRHCRYMYFPGQSTNLIELYYLSSPNGGINQMLHSSAEPVIHISLVW